MFGNLFGSSTTTGQESTQQDDLSSTTTAADTFHSVHQPMFALDQLKHAGVPLKVAMSPYLQIDPTVFKSTTPEYIMPEGYEQGRGKFEFALGHIGMAVGSGFIAGCVRGFLPELVNTETRKLRGRAWLTRMVNATVKHGSGYAQPAGAAVFIYSAIDILLKRTRADDELNPMAAGAIAGALYRSVHGARAAGVGGGIGLALATLWVLSDRDSRQRLNKMIFQRA